MKTHSSVKQPGFMLPSVIVISSTLFILGLAIAQLVTTDRQFVAQRMFELVAQNAAKSGVDYAKEQFNANPAYSGTSEFTLSTNSTYKITFTVTVLSTSTDGNSKRVDSVGKVYFPATSTSAFVTSSLRGQVVNGSGSSTGGTCSGGSCTGAGGTITPQTPDAFSPMSWYDASDDSTLQCTCSTGSPTSDVDAWGTPSGGYLKERQSDGAQTSSSVSSSYITSGYDSPLGNGSSVLAYSGISFRMTVPKNATVTSAYIFFRAAAGSTPGPNMGTHQMRVEAINPSSAYMPANGVWSTSASNQLRNRPILNYSWLTWDVPSWSVAGQAGSQQRTPDISSMVQSIVNDPSYNPWNYIAFRLWRYSGSYNRYIDKSQAVINIYYTVPSAPVPTAPTDGSEVASWNDKSGHGITLTSEGEGTGPTYRTNRQNGKPMLNFPASSYARLLGDYTKSTSSPALTIFTVMKPDSGSDTGGTAVTVDGLLPSNTETNCDDTTNPNDNIYCYERMYLLGKSGSTTSAQLDIQRQGLSYTEFSKKAIIPNIFSSSPTAKTFIGGAGFAPGGCNTTLDASSVDLVTDSTSTSNCPSGAWPKGYVSNTTLTTIVGTDYYNNAQFRGDIGEVIIYDKQLTCAQIASVQLYLRQKWFGDTNTNNVVRCPAATSPTPPPPAY